jgi:hypothetical protein
MGYYPFEIAAGNIANVSTIPGSSRFVAVVERNGFPNGNHFPATVVSITYASNYGNARIIYERKCILTQTVL